MKIFNSLIILIIVMTIPLKIVNGSSNIDTIPKFVIGIDFARFNRNWIYYADLLNPTDGNEYAFDLIPSIYLKLPLNKLALRIKYEYFKKPYSFETNGIDEYQQIDGNLIENRIFFGIERCLIDNDLKLYCFIDCGASVSKFYGKYSYNNIDNSILTDAFNIDGFTILLQSGFALKFKLSAKLDINLESALLIGKGFDKYDNHNINPELRFIPRPISLFGLSYKFSKK